MVYDLCLVTLFRELLRFVGVFSGVWPRRGTPEGPTFAVCVRHHNVRFVVVVFLFWLQLQLGKTVSFASFLTKVAASNC